MERENGLLDLDTGQDGRDTSGEVQHDAWLGMWSALLRRRGRSLLGEAGKKVWRSRKVIGADQNKSGIINHPWRAVPINEPLIHPHIFGQKIHPHIFIHIV